MTSKMTISECIKNFLTKFTLAYTVVWCKRKLSGKQAHRATHWFHIRGPAVMSCVWLKAMELEVSTALWTTVFWEAFYKSI